MSDPSLEFTLDFLEQVSYLRSAMVLCGGFESKHRAGLMRVQTENESLGDESISESNFKTGI